MLTEVKEEQEENAYSPIVVTLFGIVMEVKEHLKNALFPIVVTLSGMVIDAKEDHSKKAASGIAVIQFGSVSSFKEVHPCNTFSPKDVTLSGINNDSSAEH